MGIAGSGWELLVERLGLQGHGELARTYGSYSVHVDGVPRGIDGFMCEAVGPGDNLHKDNERRVEARTYPLSTRFGVYVSVGFSEDLTTPGAPKMPAVLLTGTGSRDGILIHPAHPPQTKLYLSSIGCMNPMSPLGPSDYMDFWDSRSRVLAIIASLNAFAPATFAHGHSTPSPHASVVVDGEPTAALPG